MIFLSSHQNLVEQEDVLRAALISPKEELGQKAALVFLHLFSKSQQELNALFNHKKVLYLTLSRRQAKNFKNIYPQAKVLILNKKRAIEKDYFVDGGFVNYLHRDLENLYEDYKFTQIILDMQRTESDSRLRKYIYSGITALTREKYAQVKHHARIFWVTLFNKKCCEFNTKGSLDAPTEVTLKRGLIYIRHNGTKETIGTYT